MRVIEETNYAIVVNDNVKKVEIIIFDNALSGQKGSSGSYIAGQADFRKRKQDDSELVDVSREKAEEPEEPESEPIEPPEIEIIPPE